MEEIEVLFEYNESRTSIKSPKGELRNRIGSKLEALGVKSAFSDGSLILQRFSKKWEAFVDVHDDEPVIDGDKLTVITSSIVPPKSRGEECLKMITKVKAPTQAEAKALASFFPSSSRAQKPFDPAAHSVVRDRQMKKKAAIKRQRDSTMTVVMMDHYSPSIPKGKNRQKLASKGKIQSIKFNRGMSYQEVKNKIIRAFSVNDFVVLDCDTSGHSLIKCEDQHIDGEKVIGRKGGLYLCKEFNMDGNSSPEPPVARKRKVPRKVISDSDSDFEYSPRTARNLKKATTILSKLKKNKSPIYTISSSASDEDLPNVSISRTSESLAETRRIIAEQDRAYAESLSIDQAKEHFRKQRKEVVGHSSVSENINEQSTQELRRKIRESWSAIGRDESSEISFVQANTDTCGHSNKVAEISSNNTESSSINIKDGDSDHDDTNSKVNETVDVPYKVILEVEKRRELFMLDSIDTHHGLPHTISRSTLYQDCIDLYTSKLRTLLGEFPFRISYKDEQAVDTGGGGGGGGVKRHVFCILGSSIPE